MPHALDCSLVWVLSSYHSIWAIEAVLSLCGSLPDQIPGRIRDLALARLFWMAVNFWRSGVGKSPNLHIFTWCLDRFSFLRFIDFSPYFLLFNFYYLLNFHYLFFIILLFSPQKNNFTLLFFIYFAWALTSSVQLSLLLSFW